MPSEMRHEKREGDGELEPFLIVQIHPPLEKVLAQVLQ